MIKVSNEEKLKILKKASDSIDMKKNSIPEFILAMSNVKDEHLHILRGHLLIEKKLRELIYLKVAKPDPLSEARLTFNQILCITESLYWERDSDWLWASIRKLNNIRNSFSHQLTPKKYNDIINEFLSIFENDNHDELGKGLSTKSILVLAMYNIYRSLNEYKYKKR